MRCAYFLGHLQVQSGDELWVPEWFEDILGRWCVARRRSPVYGFPTSPCFGVQYNTKWMLDKSCCSRGQFKTASADDLHALSYTTHFMCKNDQQCTYYVVFEDLQRRLKLSSKFCLKSYIDSMHTTAIILRLLLQRYLIQTLSTPVRINSSEIFFEVIVQKYKHGVHGSQTWLLANTEITCQSKFTRWHRDVQKRLYTYSTLLKVD